MQPNALSYVGKCIIYARGSRGMQRMWGQRIRWSDSVNMSPLHFICGGKTPMEPHPQGTMRELVRRILSHSSLLISWMD